MLERCPVLDWAASGAMALTGSGDGPPSISPAGAFGLLTEVAARLPDATRKAGGSPVPADPGELIAGRAALTGFTRRGRVSAGGSSRLLRCADGWCAVTLSRDSDAEAVPAILGALGASGTSRVPLTPAAASTSAGTLADISDISCDAWATLERTARVTSAAELADAAQLLGVPAAALPPARAAAGWPPWRSTRIAAPAPGARLAGAVVADLSSMWAGPLCARLLGQAGARVIKVESPARPDGARAGNREFYDWLHAGHRSAAIDFRSQREDLRALLTRADIVIEASRPRALVNLGLDPGLISHRNGKVWLSITGYGRGEPDRVAFGDDAAVAGGLTGRCTDGTPVFCADAVADPLTGVCGALAVCESLAEGGGHLIDLAMRDVAAAFASAPEPDHGPHEVRPDGTVTCPASGRTREVLPPRRPAAPQRAAAELGADTGAIVDWLAAGSC